MKEDLDNILDNDDLLEPSRQYIKPMILSSSFIDVHKLYGEILYGDMIAGTFSKLLRNKYFEYVGPKNSRIYIFNAASGQYLVTDKFPNAKLVAYLLYDNFYIKVIDFSNGYTRIYITNSKSVIIFCLEYDEQNKILKINNEDVIPSPLIKKLSDKEAENIITAANAKYMLHVISNN